MNLVAIARHGIGIAGVPPIAIAIARGLAIDFVRHAEPSALVVQAAGPDAEAAWLTRLPGTVRRAPLPPGIAFAVMVGNGGSIVGNVLVAEREADLGDRLATIVRLGLDSIELDRRDGSPPLPVVPRLVSLTQAEALVRGLTGGFRDALRAPQSADR